MRIHNTTPQALTYDQEGRQVEAFSFVEVKKMNPVLKRLVDTGKVIAVQEATRTVVSEPRKAGHSATQERDQ